MVNLAETCRTCGALPGQQCIKPSGKPQPVPHAMRTAAARTARYEKRRDYDNGAYRERNRRRTA